MVSAENILTDSAQLAGPKILLVSAATPDTFWSFKHALPFVSKKAAFPPLGLLTVGAMLPREWPARLVDLNVSKLTDADLSWADYVLVSAMLVQIDSAREVIARARKLNRPVVAGGPLFTSSPQLFPEVNALVLGEAEELMADLAADMAAGTLKPRYQAADHPDVALTPIPRWELVDKRHYVQMPLQFSRGCPFNCEFCDIIVMNGRIPRVKSSAQMLAELDSLVDSGWGDHVFIVDDNFIGNKAKVKPFLRDLIAWQRRRRLTLRFITEASLNLVDDPELIQLMVDAGFKRIFIGIETPAEEGLVECAKVQNTRRDLVASIKTLHNAGLEVMGGFIVGFDSDKPNIFEQQIKFIQEAGIVTAMVGLLTALPGTRLFTRLKEEGRLLANSTGNNMEAFLNFVPKLDRDTLVQGYRSLVKHLYTPKAYYKRLGAFLREYKPSGPRTPPNADDVRAFFKSLWIMGVLTRGRREYWKFLSRVLLFHRKSFPEAMNLVIMGYHFRRVAASL